MDIKLVIVSDDDGHLSAYSYRERQDFIDFLENERPDHYDELDQNFLDNLDSMEEITYWGIINNLSTRGYIEIDTVEI